jgi:hypothetical protein
VHLQLCLLAQGVDHSLLAATTDHVLRPDQNTLVTTAMEALQKNASRGECPSRQTVPPTQLCNPQQYFHPYSYVCLKCT